MGTKEVRQSLDAYDKEVEKLKDQVHELRAERDGLKRQLEQIEKAFKGLNVEGGE